MDSVKASHYNDEWKKMGEYPQKEEKIEPTNNMTIEELFGTLQQSVVSGWRKHLRSAKYGKHMALDEFYKEMPEKVDALIEAWMGAHGKKVGNYVNLLTSSNMNTLAYLKELKRVCKQGYALLEENDELKSLLDDIVNLINSTLYKVKELSESGMVNLKDFVMEALNESRGADLDKRTFDRFFGDKFGRDRNLKTTISKSMMALKSLKDNFEGEYYDMLEKLIDNKEAEFDTRSNVRLYYKDGQYGGAEIALTCDNMPKAIINKLDHVKQAVGVKRGYSAHLHSFGNTQTVNIGIMWYEDEEKNMKEDCIKLIKYVLDTIKPIFKDILSWRDDSRDEDAIRRRDRSKIE